MIELLKYYAKRIYLLLAFTGLLLIAQYFGDFFGVTVIWFFIWAIAYRLGTEERMQNTWQYFQSLPLRFSQKVLVKIGIPLALYMVLLLLAGPSDTSYQMPTHFLSHAFGIAAMMVAVSLTARSVTTFVLMALIASGFVYGLDNPPTVTIVGVLALAHALYHLSDYRLPRGRIFVGGLVFAIALMFAHRSIMTTMTFQMLKDEDLASRLLAADLILEDDRENADAQSVLASSLSQDLSARELKQTLRLIRRYDIALNYSESVYWKYIERDVESREIMLDRLDEIHPDKAWFTSESFRDRTEALVLRGDRRCTDDCQALADLLAATYLSHPTGETRLVTYLQSNSRQKVEYALLIIEQQPEIILKDELRRLQERTQDESMRVRLDLLLNDWKSERLGRDLSERIGDIVDKYINEKLSKSERRKLRKSLQKAFDEIEAEFGEDAAEKP